MRNKRGFTLMEMLLVVAIIVILAGVAVVGIADMLNSTRDKAENIQGHAGAFEPAASELIDNLRTNPGLPTREPGLPLQTTAAPAANTPTSAITPTTVPSVSVDVGGGGDNPAPAGPTNTPAPAGGGSCNSSNSWQENGQNVYQGGMNISGNGGAITRVTITFPSNVTLTGVPNWIANGYSASSSGNTFTITYTGGHQGWDNPLTSFSLSNITWKSSDTANSISPSVSITYE